MASQQQSNQAQQPNQVQQPNQTNWLVVMIVTAIVGGIVQIIVNHFDAIVAFIGFLIGGIHFPQLGNSSGLTIIAIIANVAQILSVLWIIVFGGKTISDLMRYRKRGRH